MWYTHFLPENMLYLRDNATVIFLLGLTAIFTALYHFFRKRNGRKLPPGPMGVPIFGYYPFLGDFPAKTLKKLAKKYGNVFSFYLGPQYVVVLNDWTSVKEALHKDSAINRPSTAFSGVPYNFGIAGANGPEWQQTRRLSTRIIKDTGLNRAGWEDLIKDEARDLVNKISGEGQKAVDVRSMFQESFANNVITLTLGERLPPGHPMTKTIADSVDAILQNTPSTSMINFSSTLSKLLQLLGFDKQILQFEMVEELRKFVSDTVDERVQNSVVEFEDSFIGRYQTEIQNQKKSNKSYVTVNTLKGDTIAMLTGGGETTRTSLIWTLIAMADHPDKQRKVHEELDSVIGREASISWEDRHKVPYTYATLLESLRWKTVGPIPGLRLAAEDMQIQGYHIPKGTFICNNAWALHNDPKYWNNPEEFRPERFLTDGGKKVNTSPESYVAFSYGKRNCPGRLLAHMVGLLYFTAIMQKFKVTPEDGKKAKYDIIYGLSYQATNVQLRFHPR